MFDSIAVTPRQDLAHSVVIVGSSFQIFKLLSALIEMHGYRAVHMDDLEGLRQVEPAPPRLAMVNIDESLKAGEEGLERLSDAKSCQAAPVLVFSERYRQHEVRAWVGREDSEVLCFPLSIRVLDDCLQRHLTGQA